MTPFMVALMLTLASPGSVLGQSVPDASLLVKGATVTIKLGTTYGTVRVVPHGDVVSVDGTSDWETLVFPSLAEYQIEKIDRKKNETEIDLRQTGPVPSRLHLIFPANIPTDDLAHAFARLVIPGPANSPAVDAYRTSVYRRMAKQFFTGTPMEKFSDERQLALAKFANLVAVGTTLGAETYKEKNYFVVNLGRDTAEYNDLKFSQGALVAHVVNEKLLQILKRFAVQVRDVPELQGLKLEIAVPHKSFLDQYAAPKISRLQVFAPTDLITKFANADITNQQFIDGCVVILDDNRVQVSLSGL